MHKYEQQKLEACYETYADMLYRIALSYLRNADDAEDAVHDTFVKYVHHLLRFRDEGHERAWLIRVTVNRCKDLIKRQVHRPLEEAMEIAAPEAESSVLSLLNALDENYRMAITLHHLEGFSVEETADILQISVSAVKMRLLRGRQMLKTIIEKENSDV